MISFQKGLASLKKYSDPHRKNIEHPYFDGQRIFFTNGHFLISFPAISDPDTGGIEPGFIPFPAVVEAERGSSKYQSPRLECEKETVIAPLSGRVSFPRPNGVDPPDYAVITPAEDRPIGFRATFNAEYLAALQKAAGASAVTIEGEYPIGGFGSPLKVKFSDPTITALLMPMRP